MATTSEQDKANTDNRADQKNSNNEKYDKAREGNTPKRVND